MQLISTDPSRRVQVLPPFGAFLVESDRAQVAVDEIGFFTYTPGSSVERRRSQHLLAHWLCLKVQLFLIHPLPCNHYSVGSWANGRCSPTSGRSRQEPQPLWREDEY